MLKKLAVTLAAVVATLLALSPLAMAGPATHHSNHPARNVDDGVGRDQFGLVNLNHLSVLDGANVCPDLGLNVGGILGVLGTSGGGDKTACASATDS